jgi:hypothetical protein
MIDYLAIVWAWCLAHPEIVVPAIVYVAWNVIPRTPPKDRRLFALWSLGERFMFLAWNRFGGPWKSLGIISPDPTTWGTEEPTNPDTKAAKAKTP